MLIAGLVSVTFRKLSVGEVVRAVREARLEVIEWGGDVHVPHGDVKRAREVRGLCEGEGVGCCSYGSYYRLGEGEDFGRVLETGVELGAPLIRVWGGRKGSAEVTEKERTGMVEEARGICERARGAGIKIAVEFHGKTLTDTNESSRRLVEEVGGDLRMLWQPTPGMSLGERMEGLEMVLPVLENVHVYHYLGEGYGPLEGMEEEWRGYLEVVRGTGREHCCLMEFVEGDSVEAFLRDAEVLRRMVG